ncbi:hypothetical protein BG015_002625 [Linnemannia schmuckeri]|uniref:Uncharacterized protein n=1 Tax=Linnemannia schmuckeri TaxID=64567 RepID=A0A9P5RQS5_9FUNG|nr:hypothetical protein BG015_002625 [Linnemannia schmuckeri]
MVAGAGLCVLVAAHLIMVQVVGNSHNTTYNRMTVPFPSSRMQVRALATWTSGSKNNSSSTFSDSNLATPTLDVSPMDMLILDQSNKAIAENDKVIQSITATTTTSATTATTTTAATMTTPEKPETERESENTDSHSPLVHLDSRNYPSSGYNLAGIHLLLFLLAQTVLLVLLTTLYLGVLITTEFVLEREDEDVVKARWYFWGRALGITTATIISAVHGSFLCAYVLLDGQSDCIAKAIVGTILFYWIGMIALMNRTTGPLPY